MRRIKLRQRGFRSQGTPYTGENVNKNVDDTQQPETPTKPAVKKTTKKTVASKVKDAVKKLVG